MLSPTLARRFPQAFLNQIGQAIMALLLDQMDTEAALETAIRQMAQDVSLSFTIRMQTVGITGARL
jgi:hypothetical protein